MGRRSSGQHGKIAGQMLAGWYALGTGLRPAAAETAGDWRLGHGVLFLALLQMISKPKNETKIAEAFIGAVASYQNASHPSE